MNSELGSGGSTKESGVAMQRAERVAVERRDVETVELRDEQPADEDLGKTRGLLREQPAAQLLDEREPHRERRDRSLDDVAARIFACSHRLGEKLLKVEHFDASVAKDVGEVVVLALGPLDPYDVVKEVLRAVLGSQPLERLAWTVDQHRLEPTHLRMYAESRHAHSPS